MAAKIDYEPLHAAKHLQRQIERLHYIRRVIWPSPARAIKADLGAALRQAYEAGYHNGHEDQMRCRIADEMDRRAREARRT